VVYPTLPYQLTVTRRRAIPGLRGPSAERVGIKQFGVNGKKRSKISAITAYTTAERYGAVGGLSTAAGFR